MGAARNATAPIDKYSILLPTYNEALNIEQLISSLWIQLQSLDVDFEVVVVDDNSPDNTSAVVESLQKHYGPQLVLMVRQAKLGLGSAYMHGLKRASGNFIVLMDADLSHPPKYLPAFIRRQQESGCDIVTGSRYIQGGGIVGWNARRRVISWGANFLAALLLQPGVSDVTGSYRLYRRDCLEQLVPAITSKGYAFQMEVIVRAKRAGFTIREVPIVFVDRLHGQSKMGADEIILYAKTLMRLFFRLS